MISPWICEEFEVTSIKSKTTNRPFDKHESSKVHRNAMDYKRGQLSIFDVIAQSRDMDTLRKMVRVCDRLAKSHCSDNFCDDLYFLHSQMGMKLGDWNHGRKASRALKENIAAGMIDCKK